MLYCIRPSVKRYDFTFRVGSVPYTSKYRHSPMPDKCSGWRGEHQHNAATASLYGRKLLRAKRASMIRLGSWEVWDKWYGRSTERSWKRTHKRKQWM